MNTETYTNMIAIDPIMENEIAFDNLFSHHTPLLEKAAYRQEEIVFNKIVSEYSACLISKAFGIIKDKPTAEDIVQETFLALWMKRKELIPYNIGGWLYEVVCRLSYKHLKREAYKIQHVAFLHKYGPQFYKEVEERLIYKERVKELEKIYNRLPEQQQKVFRLSREQGLSRGEIADNLNISVNTVKEHLSRAVRFARKHMAAVFLLLAFFTFNNIFLKSSSIKNEFKELYNTSTSFCPYLSGEIIEAGSGNSSLLIKKTETYKCFMF